MGRISKEVREEILNIQDAILDSLYPIKEMRPEGNQLFDSIRQCPEDILTASLGEAGKVLKKFVQKANNHPDIAKQPAWELFSRDVFQALAANGGEYKEKLNVLNKPLLRQLCVIKPRFIKDGNERREARTVKKQPKHVSMKQAYMLGENGYYSKPNKFSGFARNVDQNTSEIAYLEKQKVLFLEHGLKELSNVINKKIKSVEDIKQESYLGFHRMKPQDAAMIAAKMLNLNWSEFNFINIPFKHFENPYWKPVTDRKEEPKDEGKRLLIMKDRKMAFSDATAFSYQPRLYPLDRIDNLPDRVTDTLTAVESINDLNGCPAFDYYWILVPSININHPYFRHKDGWHVKRNVKADATFFSEEYEAALALDSALIADGYTTPVVLGERNGNCYFITLWRI